MNKINYLKDININFNKIKRLKLKIENEHKEKDDIKIKNFFETLFSFNNIENNLIYFDLDIDFLCDGINNESIGKINNFKFLRYLYIKNLNFKKRYYN